MILAAEPGATIALGTKAADRRATRCAQRRRGRLDRRHARLEAGQGGRFLLLRRRARSTRSAAASRWSRSQQNVDLTYRLYDYGSDRELHLDDGARGRRSQPVHAAADRRRGRAKAARSCAKGPSSCSNAGPAATATSTLPDGVTGWLVPLKGEGVVDGVAWQAGECVTVDRQRARSRQRRTATCCSPIRATSGSDARPRGCGIEAPINHSRALSDTRTMLRVLTLSTLFPDATRRNFGVFVERQTLGLAAHPDVELRVVAPVGLPPFPLGAARPARRARQAAARRDSGRASTSIARASSRMPGTAGAFTSRRWPARSARCWPTCAAISPFDVIDASFFFPDGPAAVALGERFGVPVSIKARGSDIHHWGTAAGDRRPGARRGPGGRRPARGVATR